MYTFQSRIRYSEGDYTDHLTIESLLDYFQDCSTFHSEDLGVGVEYLRERKLAWVLNVWQIDVNRFPKVCETVTIGTAPYEFKGFLGYRNFEMTDAQGNRLAAANTIWTLLNMETGRPVVADDFLKNKYVCEEKLDMEYLPRKIALPTEGQAMPSIVVGRHHLDTNKHVNNGQYVRMALECLPAEVIVKRLRVEYKLQAHLEDVIHPILYVGEGKYAVSLQNEEGKPYAVVEIEYKE